METPRWKLGQACPQQCRDDPDLGASREPSVGSGQSGTSTQALPRGHRSRARGVMSPGAVHGTFFEKARL